MTQDTGDDPRISVAVATFRRPDCLRRILPTLSRQLTDSRFSGEILVVDNDPAGGASDYVHSLPSARFRYAHEPEPGISAARNRALSLTLDSDLIIFIDDDEVPAPGWLDLLVGCWLIYRCAGISGPAVAQFEKPLDPWVSASGVFDRWTFRTGTIVQGAASNNLLLELRQLRELGLEFDSRFGISGGSDTMLTRSITRRGGVIRWCDEAEVLDLIPAERTTRTWAVRRTFRTSNTWSRVHIAMAETATERLRQRGSLAARGVLRLSKGLGTLGIGAATRAIGRQAAGACAVASGAGVLLGAFGYTWHEYRRPDR